MTVKDEILAVTRRGLDVFHYYMAFDFTLNKNFKNPLYEDRRASCNIFYDKQNDCYRMKDFGCEAYSGDCFWFVAAVKGWDIKSDFVRILKTIIQDLSLNIQFSQSNSAPNFSMGEYSKKKETKQVFPVHASPEKYYKLYFTGLC